MPERVRNVPKPLPRRKDAPARAGKHAGRNRALLIGAGILASAFVLLSILSYGGSNDETILDGLTVLDAFRLPFDEGVRAGVAGLGNRLGLVGAFTAHFFVDLTIGWFSLVFPLLGALWCSVLLAGWPKEKPVLVTNYALLFGLLLASTFGALAHSFDAIGKSWHGLVGAFVAEILVSLLGAVGGVVLLIAALGAAAVYLFNVDLGGAAERFGAFARAMAARRAAKAPPVVEDAQRGRTLIRQAEPDELPAPADAADGTVENDPEEEPVPIEVDGNELDGLDDVETNGESRPVPLDIRSAPEIDDDAPPRPGTAARPPARPAGGEAAREEEIDYAFPSIELLDQPRQSDTVDRDELEANAALVRSKLAHFGVEIESVSVTPGPVITLYELVPASGVKISRIVSLADDLALALAAKGIRIMAPIPGKSAVGVEIPNRNPSMVSLRSVVNSSRFRESRGNLPIALGKGISGEVIVDDLSKMPHLLIAGATGSGKSVGINTLMTSLLYRLHPSEVKFVIIDPKKIELTQYAKLKHHYLAMSPDLPKEIITTPEDAVTILKSVELEMERRYDQLAAAGVRGIQDYNERQAAGKLRDTETVRHRKIPYLVVIIDELADLMLTAAREVEDPIARLAQLARAVGIHLVLATQRPSVDVITGVIKANFPARIAFQVASKIDSRTILDMNGADQLLGSGDMLYLPSGSPKPSRIQNAYISTDEIERVTDHIDRQEGYSTPYMLPSLLEKKRAGSKGSGGQQDEFFEEAARLIVRHQQGSVSLLQRRLKVGYSRAARLVDELEAAGIVGPYDGSKAREVLVENDQQLDALLRNQGS